MVQSKISSNMSHSYYWNFLILDLSPSINTRNINLNKWNLKTTKIEWVVSVFYIVYLVRKPKIANKLTDEKFYFVEFSQNFNLIHLIFYQIKKKRDFNTIWILHTSLLSPVGAGFGTALTDNLLSAGVTKIKYLLISESNNFPESNRMYELEVI